MTEKMAQTTKYPFCALVGQEMMKEAIVLNMIDPGLGGVLIRGQKGTAKTTAVRGIPDLMPDMKVVEIPANATEDRVAGSIDIEAAMVIPSIILYGSPSITEPSMNAPGSPSSPLHTTYRTFSF